MVLSVSCLDEKQQSEMILRHYIHKNTEQIRHFSMESKAALWDASLSGNEKDYRKLIDLEMDFINSNQKSSGNFAPDRFSTFTQNVFTNEKDFQLLRKLKNSGLITDTLLKRELAVLYQSFMGPQVDAERYKKLRFAESRLWQSFSAVEVAMGDKKYRGLHLDSLRNNSADLAVMKAIHEAYREKGREIAGDILQMVKTRNEFAQDFGYRDYYQLALESQDQTPEKLTLLLDGIGSKTDRPYFEAKEKVDRLMAKKYHATDATLRSFQYACERTSYLPQKFLAKMDSLYLGRDPIQLAAAFFDGVGLPVREAIERSDLKYRKGKSTGTNIFNIDFRNDVRMMATIYDNMDGMRKMMHLGGHASHLNGISDSIPYLLKEPNPVVAEGIASFFEHMPSDIAWLERESEMDSIKSNEYKVICMHLTQVDRLYRLRRLLVRSVFEREIYSNPDQNLGELWYLLNEEYLGIAPPTDRNTTDWATTSYFTSLSCTVHNFVLADMFAAQLRNYVEKNILTGKDSGYQNNREVGKFLVTTIYRYGDLIPWEQLIERATGEPLNPGHFANYLSGANEVKNSGY